jgi:RND superfamily putative drug exporter
MAVLAVGALGWLTFSPDPTPVKEFRTKPDSLVGYELFRKSFPVGAVSPSTVLVSRANGPVTQADVARVTRALSARKDVTAVVPSPDRSRDGHVARLALVFASDPLRPQAKHAVEGARGAVDNLAPGLTVSIGDGAARFRDQGVAERRDLLVVAPLALAVILLVLICLLRALVAPLFLLGTVVLSYLGSMGMVFVIFNVIFGRDGIDPLLPMLSFIFLVALGVDYNIFLMSRIREEAVKRGTRNGILRGLVSTGPVITSAGLILAGTFLALTTLPVWLLMELGFAVAFGVAIDTFLVRSTIVPAITTMLDDKSWWPSTARTGTRGLSGVREVPLPASTPAPDGVPAVTR